MSGVICLDARLAAVMDLVKPGSVAADIGTDHGYLICALAKAGIIERGFACDVNLKPLERAKKTIRENCLSGSIETVLTDGLTGLPHWLIDTIIIAGMGGDLIAEILLAHTWASNSRFHFILQPMTKPGKLRKAIFENGFTISSERAVISANKVYTVMSVKYTDSSTETDDISLHTGMLLDNDDFPSRLYLEQTVRRLEKKAVGFKASKTPEKACQYAILAAEIRERIR